MNLKEERSEKFKEIIELFNNYDIEISRILEEDEYISFAVEDCILFLTNNLYLYLSFDVTTKPNDACFLTTLLMNEINFNKVLDATPHYERYDRTYYGDLAYKMYQSDLYDNFRKHYENNEKELDYIKNFRPTLIC
jgi:hypothetical protein